MSEFLKTSPESPESEVIAKVEEEEEVPMEVDGEEAAALIKELVLILQVTNITCLLFTVAM